MNDPTIHVHRVNGQVRRVMFEQDSQAGKVVIELPVKGVEYRDHWGENSTLTILAPGRLARFHDTEEA